MESVIYDISVRELAGFVHRRGDLGGSGGFQRSDRALAGIKAHKRIRQSRGHDYRPEVPVEHIFVNGDMQLRVVGWVDGLVESLVPLVEEIKTVETRWNREADAVHWAQLRLYAGILALDQGWSQASLQLTYLELDTNEIFIFRKEAPKTALLKFLNETVEEWFSCLSLTSNGYASAISRRSNCPSPSPLSGPASVNWPSLFIGQFRTA